MPINPLDTEIRPTAEERLRFIGLFLVIAISTILFYIAIQDVLEAGFDTSAAVDYARRVLVFANGAKPEPNERIVYFLAIAMFSALFFVLIFAYHAFKPALLRSTLHQWFTASIAASVIIILFVAYKGFAAANPYHANMQNLHDRTVSNWDFYFSTTFLHAHLFIYSFLLFPALLWLFCRNSRSSAGAPSRLSTLLPNVVTWTLAILVFFICTFRFPYTYENKYDFNAVFYSVIQVYHGLPLLVDNFTTSYGLYPHFVVPLLKLFGLSILSFTLVMAVLLSACFILFFRALQNQIESRWLSVLSLTTFFFNAYAYARIVIPFDAYFATCPIRWVLLLLLVYIASVYPRKRSKVLFWSSLAIFALGVLWNPEVGIVCFVSTIALHCYLDLDVGGFWQVTRKWLTTIASALAVLAVTLIGYEFLVKLVYGKFPDLLKMFSTIKAYSLAGIGMLPMPTGFHPYLLVVLIYLVGLLLSVDSIVTRRITPRSAFIFANTVLGILFFQYYLGRSHNWNLFVSNPTAFVLLTVFADDLLRLARRYREYVPLFATTLYALGFSTFQVAYDYKRLLALTTEEANIAKHAAENEHIVASAAFIKGLSKQGEGILILSAPAYQSLYHVLSGTYSAFNPGFMELTFKVDYERLLTMLRERRDVKIFVEPALFQPFDAQLPNALNLGYETKQSNGSLYYLSRKESFAKLDSP